MYKGNNAAWWAPDQYMCWWSTSNKSVPASRFTIAAVMRRLCMERDDQRLSLSSENSHLQGCSLPFGPQPQWKLFLKAELIS